MVKAHTTGVDRAHRVVAGCPVVLMHSRGGGKTMDDLTDYDDVMNDILA